MWYLKKKRAGTGTKMAASEVENQGTFTICNWHTRVIRNEAEGETTQDPQSGQSSVGGESTDPSFILIVK